MFRYVFLVRHAWATFSRFFHVKCVKLESTSHWLYELYEIMCWLWTFVFNQLPVPHISVEESTHTAWNLVMVQLPVRAWGESFLKRLYESWYQEDWPMIQKSIFPSDFKIHFPDHYNLKVHLHENSDVEYVLTSVWDVLKSTPTHQTMEFTPKHLFQPLSKHLREED